MPQICFSRKLGLVGHAKGAEEPVREGEKLHRRKRERERERVSIKCGVLLCTAQISSAHLSKVVVVVRVVHGVVLGSHDGLEVRPLQQQES